MTKFAAGFAAIGLAAGNIANLAAGNAAVPEYMPAPAAVYELSDEEVATLDDAHPNSPFRWGEETKDLLANHAPIQLIYVPPTDQEHFSKTELSEFFDEEKRTERQAEIKQAFTTATGDRYQPAFVTSVETTAMDIDGCLDKDNDEQKAAIYSHVDRYIKPGALNLILTGINGCDGSAYAAEDEMPVFGLNSLLHTANIAVHEVGHKAGVGHANALKCRNPVEVANCETLPEEDRISAMGYRAVNRHYSGLYTAPDLYAMDMLKDEEVLFEPPAGIYTLRGQTEDQTLPKAIVFRTPTGTAFISWEKEYGLSDVYCAPQGTPTPPELPDYFSYSSQVQLKESGSSEQAECYLFNRKKTHSLQLRVTGSGEGWLREIGVVARPEPIPHDFVIDPIYGTSEPGSVIFESNTAKITLKELDKNGHPVVEVTAK